MSAGGAGSIRGASAAKAIVPVSPKIGHPEPDPVHGILGMDVGNPPVKALCPIESGLQCGAELSRRPGQADGAPPETAAARARAAPAFGVKKIF